MSKTNSYLIVGAGFSGSVLARQLVESLDCQVLVIDERNHIAGNCHTSRDEKTGILIHKYGPHIFNTNNKEVWDYVNKYGRIRSFINRVKASTSSGIFSLPINLHTINQFYNKSFTPAEARNFLLKQADSNITEPKNFEEQAIKLIGKDLYQTFIYGYTKKQWGCEPKELPASIFKRLPVRFNYDDNYYSTIYQGIPENGYSAIIENILKHSNIKLSLNTSFDAAIQNDFDHVFYTGAIDRFFNFKLGRLGYRTVTFTRFDDSGDYQGNAVINYPDYAVPYTRVHEHKHFLPCETHEKTVYFQEFSKETGPEDTPYYPKRLEKDLILLEDYKELAKREENISFLGRLGSYRYLNMDQAIAEALEFSKIFISNMKTGLSIPTFL